MMKRLVMLFLVVSGLLMGTCSNKYRWESLLDQYETTLDEFIEKMEDGNIDYSLKYRLDELKQQINEIYVELEEDDPEEAQALVEEYDRRFGSGMD